jgi:hypothetical protein
VFFGLLALNLIIDVPAECPAAAFEARMAGILAEVTGEARLEVQHQGGVWVAELALGTGVRRLVGSDCATLLDAVGLSLEVALLAGPPEVPVPAAPGEGERGLAAGPQQPIAGPKGSKISPEDSKIGLDGPKTSPEDSKIGLDGPKTSPEDSKIGLDGPKTSPEDSKIGLDGPKTSPEDSKIGLDGPKTSPEKPKNVSKKPTMASEKPIMASEKPTMASEKPIVASEKPIVASEKPIVASEKPIVASEKPIVASEKPIVASEKPIVVSEKPIVASEKPIVVSDKPIMGSEKPIVASDKPIVGSNPFFARAPRITAAALLDLGTTPGLTAGAVVGFEYPLGPGRLGIEAAWLASAEAASGPGTVHADAFAARLIGCLDGSPVGLCGTATAAFQRVGGEGFDINHKAQTPFLSAGVRARHELWLAPVSLWLEAALPLSRTRLRVDGEVVWETSPVVLQLGLGGRFDL